MGGGLVDSEDQRRDQEEARARQDLSRDAVDEGRQRTGSQGHYCVDPQVGHEPQVIVGRHDDAERGVEGQVPRPEVPEAAGVALFLNHLGPALRRHDDEHPEEQRDQQAARALLGQKAGFKLGRHEPGGDARDHEQQGQAPRVDHTHDRFKGWPEVLALHVPVPGHVEHAKVVEDEQQKGAHAKGVEVVAAGCGDHAKTLRGRAEIAACRTAGDRRQRPGPGGGAAVTGMASPGTNGGSPWSGGGRGDGLFLAIGAVFVTVLALVNALSVTDEMAEAGAPVPFWEPMVWEGSSVVMLALFAPAIMALTRRVWPLDRPWTRALAVHGVAAVVVSFLHVVGMGALRWAIYEAVDQAYDPLGPLRNWDYELRKDLVIYAGFVGLYVIWRRLRPHPEPDLSTPEVLEVRDGARRHFVPLADVLWVEAAGNYVELHRHGASVLHRASLAQMEAKLAREDFLRIHRSRLVRRSMIAAVESKPSGDFIVRLADRGELAGSRRYRAPLLDRAQLD